MANTKKYGVLLYGATGFTGKLTAAYLDQHPDLTGKRWAIAGRNAEALAAVRATLTSDQVDVVACSLDDTAAVESMVSSSKVVITTAGPYSLYQGDQLLGACARLGVHYSDLSGEGFWQREMIDAYHDVARQSGSKIVLGGGVDSIPSDLGAYLALKGLGIKPQEDTYVQVTGKYTEYSGSFSGGTLASGRARQAAIRSGRLTKDALHDPYILAPGAQGSDREERTLDGMPPRFKQRYESGNGLLLPFFMGIINAPVVRRSLALAGVTEQVSYRECCAPVLWSRIAWLYASRGLGFPLGQPIKFIPKSGEGPPPWLLKQGAFCVEVSAEADDGRRVIATVSGKGDPGYGATSKMLAELALCLMKDRRGVPRNSGVLTPASALGDGLVTRLNAAQDGRFMNLELS